MNYHTGATFVPGGDDSYYMPEIIQPTPNRVHELPNNIQQNVAQMEQAASNPNSANSAFSGSIYSPQSAEYMQGGMQNWTQSQVPHTNPQSFDQTAHMDMPTQSYKQDDHFPPRTTSMAPAEQPNFSPFPALHNPPPNIPPTDEQKEATLEGARAAVLNCHDPDTQLTWAQDVLSYVEVCLQNEERVALAQAPRTRTPRIEHVLREDALKIVNFLADQRHPQAEFMRGMWLEFGKFGHRVDKKEAFYCYTRAAEKGYIRADYRIGMQFESSNDALKAIRYYQKGADAGDSAACYRLGMMTLLGQHGQAQNFELGVNLIYMSAQTADENAPQGAYVFGMLQAQQMPQIQIPDQFLPRDIAGAKMNIEKAAYLGFAKAQVKMGSAYELCELGCSFDPALSLHYNVLAARQGEPEAELAISKWFLCGHEGLFEKNEEISFTYAQRAALSGFPTAQFALGYYYEVGIYVPVNFDQAREWYRKASQSGNQDATGRIEAISRSKTLSRKDHESVALKKIRQQRGSMIGGADMPPAAPAMPTLSEESEPGQLEMPDPSRLSLNNQRPPSAKPGSTIPYPTGPPNMPSVNQDPNFRPPSAFGINPNLRPTSAAAIGGPRPDPYGSPPLNMAPQQRPYSNPGGASYPGPGYGRGGRMPSGGPPPPQAQGIPTIRPPSRPNSSSPYPGPGSQPGGQSPPARIDIGFSAPLEPERRPRPQQQQPNGSPRLQQGPPAQQGPPSQNRPGPPNSRPGPVPAPNAGGYGGMPNPNARPPPNNKMQVPPNVRPANLPPSKPDVNAPAGGAPPSRPNAVPAAAARPPGKGPKTFDEMGVPQGKDKSECAVM